MKLLRDKVAVITGAGSGIGRALAYGLAQKGCHLALSDINEAGVKETQALCELRGVNVQSYILDVTDRAAVFAHADAVEYDFGQVNLIFNNAGVVLSSRLLDMNLDDFEWLMDINFWGVVYGTQAFLPKLIASGDGHVVNISSVYGLISMPKQGPYNASKFAVRGYTEAFRQEMRLEKVPVEVSCVHPGFISTNLAKNARIGSGDMEAERMRQVFDKVARTHPDKASKVIIKGVLRNKARILVGLDAYGAEFLHRAFGAGYSRITEFIARRLLYRF